MNQPTRPMNVTGLLMPPPEGLCPVCASNHEPCLPHNAESLYYQLRFKTRRGRTPTWEDAAAHCTAFVRATCREALKRCGIEWSVPPNGEAPIADPPHDAIREVIEVATAEIEMPTQSGPAQDAAILQFCHRASAQIDPNHIHDWHAVNERHPVTGVEVPSHARCSICGAKDSLDVLNHIPY